MNKVVMESMMKLIMLTRVFTPTHSPTYSLTYIYSLITTSLIYLFIDENGEIDLEATAAIDYGSHNHHEFLMDEDSMDVNLMQTNSLLTAPHIY